MQRPQGIVETDIVLVGAGHAHVQVMRAFGMEARPGIRVTVIVDRLLAPYSGMLPGCIAGDYTADDLHIDVNRLARANDIRLIHAAAIGIDRMRKQVLLKDRPPIAYDVLSINVGIAPDLSGLSGAEEHALPVKPIAGILERLAQSEARLAHLNRSAKLAVVGGGAAGVELALALRDRYRGSGKPQPQIMLIAGSGLVPGLSDGVRSKALRALAQADVGIVAGDRAVAIGADHILLASGRRLDCDMPLVSTSARIPSWLTATDLPKAENGGLALRPTLQTTLDDAIFAAGDCASIIGEPRPRAGVFAVRQGPVLSRNLLAAARGERLVVHKPQHDFLTILRSGRGRAIAGRGRFLSVEGGWVWRWKDRIDRAFMERFRVEDADPTNEDETMRCGGCAAKVGPEPLQAALSRLPSASKGPMPAIGLIVPDDAAVIDWRGAPLVQSVDQFRTFVSDPFLFGRIAANHALNDIYAMGAKPHHALALATLPHGRPETVSEDLFQLLAGARMTLDAAGCTLAGGHSSEGEALALGLSVSGALDGAAITKTGAKPSDALILTKPLGTGIVFAADMRASARAATVEAMLGHMLMSNAEASRILRRCGARAMTDVSGFGLIGHLGEMLGAGCGAAIAEASLPISAGAKELTHMGFSSSLLPENQRLRHVLIESERLQRALMALLFDPQTAGGLLAAIPVRQADAALIDLVKAGYNEAAIIGHVTGAPGIAITA